MRWFKDEDFIRKEVPMTKYDIRVLVSSYFGMEKRNILEIGSGTGSITCQLVELGHKVTSIDSLQTAVDLTHENLRKFGLKADIYMGRAPKDLEKRKYQACFIGGSKGNLKEIFEYLDECLEEGPLVATFIKLSNQHEFLELLREYGYKNIVTKVIQVSKVDRLGLLKAENPVFIIKGEKIND